QSTRKCKAGRKAGFAIWPRPAIPGLWGSHNHGIQIGNSRASASAKRQVQQYYAHTNGLASHGWDSFWRPSPIRTFNPRKPLVGWRRLNRLRGKQARSRESIKQVELLYRALEGFNFEMRGHKRGRYDETMQDAIKRLQALKFENVTKHGTVGPKTLAVLCLPHKAGKKKRKPKINITVLQNAWDRRRGRTFGKGQFIIRKFAKPLIKRGFLKNWHWKDATYGRNMRDAIRAANKHYGITKWTGPNNDRPTWALAKKLGFDPYRPKKKG
ncbi:MAG: peptidoglycan-binding protein, partial [Actinomycetia bacterium]|nr:peptidoglycan-binding protein [Actinomycetes bacterium]